MKYLLTIIAILIFSFANAQPKKPVIKVGLRSDTSNCVILYNNGKYDSSAKRISRTFVTKSGQSYPKGVTYFGGDWKAIKDEDIFKAL